MKDYLLKFLLAAICITGLGFSTKAQSVLLDAHSKAGGLTTWQITTTRANELIIIAADGYGTPNVLSTSPGTVKVNGNNATYITKGEWHSSWTWVSSIWAYEAPIAGTYTMTCTETGLNSPFYFNYSASVYDPTAVLRISDILIGGHDSNQGQDTVRASITTTKNNSWVYGTTCWNDNPKTGTLNWQGGLTEIDNDYIASGVDGAQADSTMAIAGPRTITVVDAGVSSPWSSIALIAVQPPTCSLSVSIDSIIQAGCNDSLWAVVTGGSGNYSFKWTGGYTADTIGHLCAGTYTVMVTDDSTGCMDSATIDLAPLGVKTINQKQLVNIYPSPFAQSINVNASQPVVVTLFNMLGENVGSWSLSTGHQTIDAQQYPSGVYMIQAKTLDGTMLLSEKVIKLAQ